MYGLAVEFAPSTSLSVANFGVTFVFSAVRIWLQLSVCILCGKYADDDLVHPVVSSVVCTSLSGDDEMSAMIPLSVNKINRFYQIKSKKKSKPFFNVPIDNWLARVVER